MTKEKFSSYISLCEQMQEQQRQKVELMKRQQDEFNKAMSEILKESAKITNHCLDELIDELKIASQK